MKINIQNRLLKIIQARFNVDYASKWEEIKNQHLLGIEMGFEASELLYVYFDIEKEFEIKIPREYIVSGKFSTLSNIAEMIESELLKTSVCGVG